MQLRCDEVVPGLDCEYVAHGDTIDEAQAAMMSHGGAEHAALMDGMSPEEMEKAGAEMASHIRQLLEARA